MKIADLKPGHRRAVFAALMIAAAAALALFALSLSPRGPLSSGEALVGGPFTMVNQRGETVTEKTFLGKPMIVFFGFTFCPDICPTQLQVMAAALAELGAKGEDIQPVFVTVDPARDTPPVMAAYVEAFGPRFVGLTGSPEQVAAMASAFRVYFARVENKERPQDYLMDHTAILYLMGRDGRFIKHFAYATDPAALASDISAALP